MSISYLPALKDKHGNVIIGLMGQFDSKADALERQVADSLMFLPFQMTSAGLIEYDSEVGLPHVEGRLFGTDCAVISGPIFDEVSKRSDNDADILPSDGDGQHSDGVAVDNKG